MSTDTDTHLYFIKMTDYLKFGRSCSNRKHATSQTDGKAFFEVHD